MAKFMILYNSTKSASDLMAEATHEQMKASMGEWMAWKAGAEKTFKLEFGMPLQAAARVTPDGAAASDSMVSGYSIADGATKEALVESLMSHPHLKRPGAFIDVLEFMAMPGIEG